MRKVGLRQFQRDTRGSAAITGAVVAFVLVGFTALSLDVGKAYSDRRKAQGAVDLAAIAAVTDFSRPDAAAKATIISNGYPASTPVQVELGTYTRDPTIAPAKRFQAGFSSNANAARVTLKTVSPMFFAGLFNKDTIDITTTAIASTSAFAEFAIGSRLASLNGGLLNRMLGALLGTNLTLSVSDYNSLLSAKVDLFDFLNNLAIKARIEGPTYDSVLNSKVRVGTVIDAMKASVGNASAAFALNSLVDALRGTSTTIAIGSLVDIGPYRSMSMSEKPKVGMSIAAMDLLSATAQIANGQHQVALDLSSDVAGLAGLTVQLAIGERPVGTSWVTVGSAGAKVHTAQTRLLLIAKVNGGTLATITVPIYVEVASGTATLRSVNCSYQSVNSSSATLDVSPGIVDAWIGAVSNSQFTNFSFAPNPEPAVLVDLPLISASGRAHVTISNTYPESVTFSAAEIASATKKTVSTRNYTTSLVAGLVRDLRLDVSVAGLGLPLVLSSQISGVLSVATVPIDSALASVLATLGVGLGQADLWVPGIRCDGAVLVN